MESDIRLVAYVAVKIRRVEKLSPIAGSKGQGFGLHTNDSTPSLTVGRRGITDRAFPWPIVRKSVGIAIRAVTSVGTIRGKSEWGSRKGSLI